MQLFCTSHTSRRELHRQGSAARCERLQHHRADPHRLCEQLAALQGNYTRVRLIIPPPPSLQPLLPFFYHLSCSCYSKNITSLQELWWFKPSASSQSLIRLTISFMELMAFITTLVCSQTGFLRLFGLIPHAQIITINYSGRLTAFTKRPVISKAGWWSCNMVPLFQPQLSDTARCICLHSAINQQILRMACDGCTHLLLQQPGFLKLNLSIISIKEI